jgi:hypothetical protein
LRHSIALSAIAAILGTHTAVAACPAGFVEIGKDWAQATNTFQETKLNTHAFEFHVPSHVTVNESYQQVSGRFGAGAEISLVMSAANVPPGIHVEGSGSESACQGWALHPPEYVVFRKQGRQILDDGYVIRGYCHSGSGALCMTGGTSCTVGVTVCAAQ